MKHAFHFMHFSNELFSKKIFNMQPEQSQYFLKELTLQLTKLKAKLALDLKIHRELHNNLECLKGLQVRTDSDKEVIRAFRSDISDIETAIRIDRSMISSVESQIRMFAHSMVEPHFFELVTTFSHPLPVFFMSF